MLLADGSVEIAGFDTDDDYWDVVGDGATGAVTLSATARRPAATASRWFDGSGGCVAIEEARLRVRRSLEEKLGVEEASYLMDRPVGGWSELVTNHTLDLRFAALEARIEALRHELLGEIDRRFSALAWRLVTAVIAGMGVMGAVFAGLVVIAGS